ncbi:DUF4377 domain-containing protein [Fibrella forsythiae]|uniref:DUF4377 domain-containing protein n=1 Tax=Fibrella forsythiae TaxID=2817061 RepID=A0ABS3JJH4_9BACT|nr:DUF4377 domain-containing protein [Fibrella forsythiae]MBO0950152.1 DUF4377 domain-containing protein [Fibrella forsythiae]
MKRAIGLSTLWLLLITVFSCGKEPVNPEFITLKIASSTKDCNGPFPRKCLQVQENDSPNWQYFYGYIQGFVYQEGHEYEVLVIRKQIENPPMDGPGYDYWLVKEISKRKP